MFTIADVRYLSAAAVSKLVLAEQGTSAPSYAIVDVRDGDYIGGHIKGARHVASQSLDSKLSDVVRDLQGKKTVIFHCLLSQQRGPSAALRYMRQREVTFPMTTNIETPAGGVEVPAATKDGGAAGQPTQQTVYCLQGGFMAWQKDFADDDRLTEGYRKDLWDNM